MTMDYNAVTLEKFLTSLVKEPGLKLYTALGRGMGVSFEPPNKTVNV